MKYRIILLCLLLIWVQHGLAQFCDPEPNNPSDFDWQADSWTVWVRPSQTQSAQLITVPSPYHPNSISSQPNTAFLEAATGEGDYSPQDGWVLLAEAMGVDKPSYGVLDNEVVTRWPQFVLYNRYESKLRYFAYATDISGINDIEILTGFEEISQSQNYGSAAFEHAFTPMNSIEGFQPAVMPITTPNEFYNNSGIWLLADIPIAYDPCTCLYPSRLKIATSSTDYLTINLTLDGGGIINQVIEEGSTTNSGNFFSNIAGGITGGISKGNSAFKSASSFASQANKILIKRANERMTQEIRDNLIAEGFTNQELTLSDVEELWDQQQAGTAIN